MRVFGVIALTAALAGCPGPAATAESAAYEFVVKMDQAIPIADHLCADVALAKHDIKLAHKCRVGYDEARRGQVAAFAALRAYSSAKQGELACAAASALSGLLAITEAVEGAGVSLPSEIQIAISIAQKLASLAGPGVCVQPVADAGVSDAG